MEINVIDLLATLGTILSGIGIGWLSKSGRMKEKADAYKKMGEAYQFRIDALHEDIDTCNKTIKENQTRIAELNTALNDKTLQIRNLTDKVYTSEQEVNRVQDLLNEAKDEIIRRTEERDWERSRADYNEMWRCEHTDCRDPRGRKPPTNLSGLQYDPPRRK